MKRIAVLAALAGAAFVGTLIVEPNLIVGLRSPRALAWLAGGALICASIGLIARRLGAKPAVALVLAAIPALVATGLVVVKPILSPRELTEALPTATVTATVTTTPPTGSASPSPAPVATPAVVPARTQRSAAPVAPPAPGPSQAATAAGATPAPATTRVATDELTGLAGHSAKGRVSTYRLADGSHVIRFENVDIGGTPDPEVYLLAGKDQTGKQGGLHLGELKAEKGSFNYVLPARFVGTDFTVLVWCDQFAVDIAHASP